MAFGLNIFKTVTVDLTTSGAELYTAPPLYSAIILSAQISNNTTNIESVSLAVLNLDSTETALLTDFEIPGNDAVSGLVGKLVLETGRGLTASASANGAVTCVLSILESKN
jgi:hypothetical protein